MINNPGIYKLTNTITNQIYIGSAKNLRLRMNRHTRELNKNIHINSKLQNSWNKYGGENFKFDILETLDAYIKETILAKEQYYINYHKSHYDFGNFNICKFTTSPSKERHTLETKQKMSKAHRNRKKYNNTSGYVGIYKRKDINKWHCQITRFNKSYHLGYYAELNEAIQIQTYFNNLDDSMFISTFDSFKNNKKEFILKLT